MQPVYIFGHKMPDTDSVCASISLSYLKNSLGMRTEPRVLGALNKETKFVLDYFNIPEPQFLNDVKVQMRNMVFNKDVKMSDIINDLPFKLTKAQLRVLDTTARSMTRKTQSV